MPNCVNHPTRGALHTCRRCGKPLCDQCNQELARFCSVDCQIEFKEFQSRVINTSVGRRSRFSLLGCLRTFLISIVLIIVIWFALVALLGTSSPTAMVAELQKMWRLIF